MAAQFEPQKFEQFYTAHYSAVRAVLWGRLSNAADVDDIASTVFEAAWLRYQKSGDLSAPWLFGVIRNQVAMSYRRSIRARDLLLRMLPAPDSDDFDRLDDDHGVRVALRRLRARDQEVIFLVYWNEMSVDEVAATLDIRPATARARLSRARSRLRDLLTIDPKPLSTSEVAAHG